MLRQHPGAGGEESLVDPPQPWTAGFSLQHLYLMAKDQQFDLAVTILARHHPDQQAKDQVKEREQHGPLMLQERRSNRRSQ
jgi:hypothetical protein